MMEMMETCWNWMMGLGWIGMFVGLAALVVFAVLLVALIQRFSRGRSRSG